MEAQVVNVRLIYKLCTDELVVNRPVTMGSTSVLSVVVFELHQRHWLFPHQRIFPHCLVLVGSRNGFECNFTIKLK